MCALHATRNESESAPPCPLARGLGHVERALDQRGLDLALVAGVALEAVAEARVVVALAAAAGLVVVVVGLDGLRHVRERAERRDVDARELRRAAVAALGRVDDEVLRALHRRAR